MTGKVEYRKNSHLLSILCLANAIWIRYWQISADAQNILQSSVWDPQFGVGGNGAGGNGCIQDGPFSNLTLHFNQDGRVGEPYCLTRSINVETYKGSSQRFVDECLASPTFMEAHNCYENFVHTSAHEGTGGVVSGHMIDGKRELTRWQMANALTAPGDPIFFLHRKSSPTKEGGMVLTLIQRYQPGSTFLGMAKRKCCSSWGCGWC